MYNLLCKQKWPIVEFFGEAVVGRRKIPGADFIQVIRGVWREQNGSELLPLPMSLCADLGWFQWGKCCWFSKGHFLLSYPQSLEIWRGKGGQGCEK